MDLKNGEYTTVCDNFLDGYVGKVYGHDNTVESRQSWTMQKVIIENGKVISATGEIKGYPAIKELESNTENTTKNITKVDNNTNIKLEASSGIIPENTTIDIIEITSGSTFDKIKNNLNKVESFKAFDITLKSNGTNIQPNGKVKISIPIPEEFDISRLIVYRFGGDDTKTEYQVKVANNYATFETEHFSTYVLGEKEKLSSEAQDKTEIGTGEIATEKKDTKLPQTGEKTNVFTQWLSIVIILGIIWLGSMLLIDREKKKMTKK